MVQLEDETGVVLVPISGAKMLTIVVEFSVSINKTITGPEEEITPASSSSTINKIRSIVCGEIKNSHTNPSHQTETQLPILSSLIAAIASI
jgi:hypothetical protein